MTTACACDWLDDPSADVCPDGCPCHEPAIELPAVTVEPGPRGRWDVIASYPSGTVTRVGRYTAKYRAIEHAARLLAEREGDQ